ncbi:murein biosynthesis integral membrane protein MurJ [Lysobacter arvi]|uniref:Lipid II flippase MurJ n=1 Tax=Lysobacter arvi TaxID=3038776 RepID=A0ABU1C970_9GAMM|nr:lipid II flippase MurJ [Lysobacter arvi]MDR0181665.1 lipid II flippase MurJ [Lysobacter arvi]
MSRSIVSIAAGNLASKALGVLREVLFAAWFGTGEVAAAFRICQTAFLLPTHALIGDSLGPGLLPLYRGMRAEGRGGDGVLLLIASTYAVVFSLVCGAVLYSLSHLIVIWIAPGSAGDIARMAAAMLRTLSIALPFYVLGYLLGYVEAAHGRFGAIAWRPLAFNFGSILGAAIAVATGVDSWVAIGLVIGHVLFFAWTVVQIRRLGQVFPESMPSWNALLVVSGRFFRNVAPLLPLPLLSQANVIVERIVSSRLGEGVIPSVDYARFVAETAIQLIAVPIGIKTMSLSGGDDSKEAGAHVRMAAALVMMMAIPVGAFVFQNASEIVEVLFARGKFDQAAVQTTSAMLRWFGGSLGAAVVGYYFVRALNAQLRNKSALCLIGIAVGVNVLINVFAWSQFGAQVIGLGSAAYAAVLMVGGLTLLRLWQCTARLLAWLMLGCVGTVLMCSFVPAMNPLARLSVNALVFGAFWIAFVFAVPEMRRVVEPVLSRIRLPGRSS